MMHCIKTLLQDSSSTSQFIAKVSRPQYNPFQFDRPTSYTVCLSVANFQMHDLEFTLICRSSPQTILYICWIGISRMEARTIWQFIIFIKIKFFPIKLLVSRKKFRKTRRNNEKVTK